MEEPEKACLYCSGPVPDGRQSEYCSSACVKAKRKGYTAARPYGEASSACRGCGSKFERSAPKQIFCTRQCRALHVRAARPDKQCLVCGIGYSPSSKGKTCSPECSDRLAEIRALELKLKNFGPPRTCCQCGKIFTHGGDAFKDFCSRACATECAKETQKRHGHVRRARKAKATIEHFNPTYILKRDKYICQACGVKTRPDKKPNHPLYPNVDHIVPLSVGGEHSKKNCRCVCTSCNSKKCNRTLNDQLLLFG